MADDDRYDIEGVAFIGRTFTEYARLFGVDDTGEPDAITDWDGMRVLDCPGGSCGLRAGAAARGASAWAVDPLYGPSVASLAQRGRRDVRRAMDGLDGVTDLYRWDYYPDRATLERHRMAALGTFLADYADSDRYLPAALPHLPFPDGAFDLTLSAHFLFLYADRFDHAFHDAALRELCRVTDGEVRVFPLVDFGTDRYERLPELCDRLREAGHDPRIHSVAFEFQRGADEVLVVETA